MTVALGVTRLFLRRLRFDKAAPLTMVALVAATCFLFAALPRLANSTADRGLRYTVVTSDVLERNVRVREIERVAAAGGADPTATVADRAIQQLGELPGPLREVIGDSSFVVRSPRYVIREDNPQGVAAGPRPPDTGLVRYLSVRVQSGIAPFVQVVSGRLPRPSEATTPVEVTQFVNFGDPSGPRRFAWTNRVPVLEVAMSRANARALRLQVGNQAIFDTLRAETLTESVPLRELAPLVVKVVGIFMVRNPDDPFWFGDTTLRVPDLQSSAGLDLTQVFGQALALPTQYPQLLEATNPIPLAYEYRYPVEPKRFDAGNLPSLRTAVSALDARYAGAGPLDRRVEVGLKRVLDRYGDARSQAETLLAIAAIGLLACALANLGLLGALSYDRRKTETALSRTRGAGSLQVLTSQAAEGLLIAAPAGLTGFAIAVLAIEARRSGLSAWLAVGLVFATVVLLVAAVAGVARRPIGSLGREDVVLARPSPRRLAFEGLVAGVAALGIFLLRRRGLEPTTGTESGFDPYLAAVPVLLGLACGIVALRLYPLPVALAARLAKRTRGLALHLGLSRAARQPDLSVAPLLVLVLALAIACFSAAMLSTLEEGQARTAWTEVGAEVRVDAPPDGELPASLVERLRSQGIVAPAFVRDAQVGLEGEETPMIAVDLAAYERLVSGTPAAVRFPLELREAPIPGLVPALVSTNWPATGTFQAPVPRHTINTITIGNRDRFPTIPAETPFAIVPLGSLEEAAGEKIAPNRLYLRGVSEADVRKAVAEEAPAAEISSRAGSVRQLRASPLVENVFRGFRATIVLAAVFALVAVALMGLIAARSRSRDLALVRTMGASQRESLVLAAAELTPLIVTALIVGVALGAAIPHLIAPGLDLAFFTGNSSSSVVVPWRVPALLAGGMLLLVTAAVVIVGIRTRRTRLDRVLRIGER